MDKNFIGVVSFSLVLGVLTTHWLNIASTPEPATATSQQRLPNPSKTLNSQKEPKALDGPQMKRQRLQSAWNQVKDSMYSQSEDFEVQATTLKRLLKDYRIEELAFLSESALRSDLSEDQRSSAVYMLSLAGPVGIPLMTRIASSPLSAKAETSFEVSIRTTALEHLDQWAAQGNEKENEVRTSLEAVLKTQTNPTLKMFAQVSLEGLLEKKPGKLLRLSQKSFEDLSE